jgi:hypothetical protein
MSSSLQHKLTSACDKAGSGDVSGARKVISQVCTQVVKASVPSSSPTAMKDQLLAACKKAAG